MADPTVVDRQISLPFSFGPDGAVATTSDLTKQLADHVLSAVGTQQGERAMNSTYGTKILPYLFAPDDDILEQEITQEISQTLGTNVPEVAFQSTSITADPSTGSLSLDVNYGLGTDNEVTASTTVPVQIGS
jgi:phage baseplate assembly protein W